MTPEVAMAAKRRPYRDYAFASLIPPQTPQQERRDRKTARLLIRRADKSLFKAKKKQAKEIS
jgi:hypothetical protein